MTFSTEIARAMRNIRAREQQLKKQCDSHVLKSVTVGSNVTGAPGQPVEGGALLGSFRMEKVSNTETDIISRGVPYADVIEENVRGATLRSSVGGFHSVKMTRLGWNKIVAFESQRIGQGEIVAPTIGKTPQPRDKRGRFARKQRTHIRIVNARRER
jgi:hypothetical protein